MKKEKEDVRLVVNGTFHPEKMYHALAGILSLKYNLDIREKTILPAGAEEKEEQQKAVI